jgi:anti-sigma B factor antagonist
MTKSALEVVVEVDLASGATVRASGEIDGYSAPALRHAVTEASLVCPGALVLDMSAVTFMDSSGLGALVALDRELRSRRCQLVVTRPSLRVW